MDEDAAPMDEDAAPMDEDAAFAQLKQRGHRSAVGILLYAPETAPDWNAIALVHSLGQRSYVTVILSEMNPDTQFLNLDADTERDRLSRLAECPDAHACVLVTDFDIALARLSFDERARLWNNLLRHFPHRQTALLLAVPANADALLPDADALPLWEEAGKLISLTNL